MAWASVALGSPYLFVVPASAWTSLPPNCLSARPIGEIKPWLDRKGGAIRS